jgi:hypothetical protein
MQEPTSKSDRGRSLIVFSTIGFFATVVLPAVGSGLFHVVIGPDHLTAIMALSVCERSAAFWQGIRWGVGHSVGIGIVAVIVWLLGLTLSEEAHNSFDYFGPLISGVFMIALGVHFILKVNNMKAKAGFVELVEAPLPFTPIGRASETPPDSGPSIPEDPEIAERVSVRTLSLLAGIVTGAAGPGGMLAVMPASYYETFVESFSYIGLFMISSTLAMGCVALLYGNITFSFALKNKDSDKLVRGTYYFSSGMSILLGLLWIILTLLGVLGTGH